jgi:hypothetical protein
MKSGWSFRRKYFVADRQAQRPIAERRNALVFGRDRNIVDSGAEKLHKMGIPGWSFEKGGACAFSGPSGASQWPASQGRKLVVLEVLARGAKEIAHGRMGASKVAGRQLCTILRELLLLSR